MSALQDGFDSNGPSVDLKAGETKTADVALKVKPDKLRTELVDFDTLYPPGPTRDYLMNNCMGCHGFEHIPWHRIGGRDEDAWRRAVGRMFDMDGTSRHTGVPQVNPAAIPEAKREDIIKYFSDTFSLDAKPLDLKLDDLPLDEAALSKAINIEYELPPPPPGKTEEDISATMSGPANLRRRFMWPKWAWTPFRPWTCTGWIIPGASRRTCFRIPILDTA